MHSVVAVIGGERKTCLCFGDINGRLQLTNKKIVPFLVLSIDIVKDMDDQVRPRLIFVIIQFRSS